MGQDLMREMNRLTSTLELATKEYRTRGESLAKAEHDYKVANAKRILGLRAEGYAVSLISDLARGDETIARLRMERDIAEVLYKSAEEAINVYKLQIRVLSEQINREWGKS